VEDTPWLPELVSFPVSLESYHLSQAVDMFLASRRYSEQKEPAYAWIISHRNAVSAIIHAYVALESCVNLLGYSTFLDSESPHHIPDGDRDVALRKFAQTWDRTLPVSDKFEFLVSRKAIPADPNLLCEIRELAALRNYLVHGYTFRKSVLLERSEAGTYSVVDYEDSPDLRPKFPHTKFSSLDKLSWQDARTTLRIVFDCLKLLSRAYDTLYHLASLLDGVKTVFIRDGEGPTEAILDIAGR